MSRRPLGLDESLDAVVADDVLVLGVKHLGLRKFDLLLEGALVCQGKSHRDGVVEDGGLGIGGFDIDHEQPNRDRCDDEDGAHDDERQRTLHSDCRTGNYV